ncbi:DUF397 domain-containing protein [Streptomyces olivoreticuli]
MSRNIREPSIAGATWRKSTYSASNSNCVEVGTLRDTVAIRDSKDPNGPCLYPATRAWAEFISGIKAETLPD